MGVCEEVGVGGEENDSEMVGEPLLDPGEPKGIPGGLLLRTMFLGGIWAYAAISQESSDLLLLLLLLLPPLGRGGAHAY